MAQRIRGVPMLTRMPAAPPTPSPEARTLTALLTLAGFQPGAPPWVGAATLAIDFQVADEIGCECCGHVGMDCRPHYRLYSRGYRLVYECGKCGHWQQEG